MLQHRILFSMADTQLNILRCRSVGQLVGPSPSQSSPSGISIISYNQSTNQSYQLSLAILGMRFADSRHFFWTSFVKSFPLQAAIFFHICELSWVGLIPLEVCVAHASQFTACMHFTIHLDSRSRIEKCWMVSGN